MFKFSAFLLFIATAVVAPFAAAPVDAASGFPTCLVTPTGYTKFVTATDPITAAVRAANPNDLIELGVGSFRRCGPFTSGRQIGQSVTVQGQGNSTTILRDPTVGSTDAIYLGPNDHDTIWRNINVQADDRSAIKTVTGVGPNHTFDHVGIYGFGSPYDPNWKDDSKWGVHGYDTAGWHESYVTVWDIFGEHGHYYHNIKGDHSFDHVTVGFCGRTAWQFVNRMNEGAIGVGSLSFTNCLVFNVCLEQGGGGSAFTFRGGMPTSDIVMDSCGVYLGADKGVAAPFNASVTGSMVIDSAPESAPGKGDGAYPGGLHSITITHSIFRVGDYWHGSGSAIRPNFNIDWVGNFSMSDCTVSTIRDASAHAISFTFGQHVGEVHFGGAMQVVGEVVWSDGARFKTFEEFEAAHPEVVTK